MFNWLENELQKAEDNDEFVYILNHFPLNGEFTLSECGKRFQALFDRYEYNIRGIFSGHTHRDDIEGIHEYFNKEKIIHLNFVAPQLTTYEYKLPSYRIYTIDKETKQVLDYEQFRLDRSVWLTREDYESKAESGDEDNLELDKAYSDDDVETMYVMSDGSPSDGAAVFYVTKPVYSPSYTKDTVPIIVNSVNEAMQQDIDMGETYEFISCTAYDVGEYSAVHAVQKDKVFGIPMKMDHYQFFEDGDVFIVNFCAPADRYDDLKPEFDSIIKSIKIDH